MKNFRHQHQRPKKNTLVIGREAVIKAMQEGQQLDRIYLQSTVHGPVIDEIRKLATEFGVPINKVPVEKLNGFNISIMKDVWRRYLKFNTRICSR